MKVSRHESRNRPSNKERMIHHMEGKERFYERLAFVNLQKTPACPAPPGTLLVACCRYLIGRLSSSASLAMAASARSLRPMQAKNAKHGRVFFLHMASKLKLNFQCRWHLHHWKIDYVMGVFPGHRAAFFSKALIYQSVLRSELAQMDRETAISKLKKKLSLHPRKPRVNNAKGKFLKKKLGQYVLCRFKGFMICFSWRCFCSFCWFGNQPYNGRIFMLDTGEGDWDSGDPTIMSLATTSAVRGTSCTSLVQGAPRLHEHICTIRFKRPLQIAQVTGCHSRTNCRNHGRRTGGEAIGLEHGFMCLVFKDCDSVDQATLMPAAGGARRSAKKMEGTAQLSD